MPQAYTVTFDSHAADLSGTARADGYVEVVSKDGHGVLVVTPEVRDLLVDELETFEDVEVASP